MEMSLYHIGLAHLLQCHHPVKPALVPGALFSTQLLANMQGKAETFVYSLLAFLWLFWSFGERTTGQKISFSPFPFLYNYNFQIFNIIFKNNCISAIKIYLKFKSKIILKDQIMTDLDI